MYTFEASYWNRKTDEERILTIEVDSTIFTEDVQDYDITAFKIATKRALASGSCSEMLTKVEFISC